LRRGDIALVFRPIAGAKTNFEEPPFGGVFGIEIAVQKLAPFFVVNAAAGLFGRHQFTVVIEG
jgi:hypothetical protein